jgi:hypothetical protein
VSVIQVWLMPRTLLPPLADAEVLDLRDGTQQLPDYEPAHVGGDLTSPLAARTALVRADTSQSAVQNARWPWQTQLARLDIIVAGGDPGPDPNASPPSTRFSV